jgi:hypothetical protein
MGRAKLKIGNELIAHFLRLGVRSAVPRDPLRDVKVLDSRPSGYWTEVLIESPDLPGNGETTLESAPDFNCVFQRSAAIDLPAGNVVALQLVRIADRACTCIPTAEDAPNRASFQCPVCLAKAALEYVPVEWRETAHDVRRELGETVPAADPADLTDEVPGA